MAKGKNVGSLEGGSNFWADKGKRIIDEQYGVLSGISEVCSKLGISESYFRDAFHMAYGVNPVTYLLQMRIEEAKKLLCKNELKLFEVMTRVGFRHRWSFNRMFKKINGVCPLEYRKMNTVKF